jgi:glycosyltransferase involved in cell wall biosynthesis
VKVLIVHDYGTLSGGAEHMSITLREGLRARGHDARLFASTARQLPGLPIVADYTGYGTMGPARRVLQAVNPFAAARLREALRDFRPDVVHVRMFLAQLSPLVLPLLREVPALLHVVNYHLICPIDTKLLPDGRSCAVRAGTICRREGCIPLAGVARLAVQRGLWERWFDAFDRVVTNSDWVRRRLELEGLAVHRVVWNGVRARSARPLLDGPPTVAFAGRLERKKGVEVLLRAFVRVAEEVPEARLVLAGDGPDRPRLERLLRDLDLRRRARLLGHLPQDRLEDALSGAWVQAVPSLWEEPFGLVAAEAMMRGTAVVASSSGGVAEIVRDGQTGLLAAPGDADDLAGKLLPYLRDRELAERTGAAARAWALAELTEERVLDRFEALYRELVRP